MSAILVENLHKTYKGGVQALTGLSFEVEEGEIFGLLGPNGAGKSTAVRILATLSTPDSGRAVVAGLDVLKQAHEVRQSIGYVSQNSTVDRTATGRENLMLQGHLFHLPSKQLTQRVDDLLGMFDLEEAADRTAETYSGGMKRRLDVAMGIIHRPQVLFLDEPTTGLDPESRAVLWREVERLASEGGLTILLTTHYLEEADRLARRLAVIDRGRVVAAGSPDQLKGSLSGDHVSVELSDSDAVERGKTILESLEIVSDVIIEGKILHAQSPSGARAVPPVVAALEGAGLAVVQVSISRPSLDDVYLALTGKSFETEHHKGG